MKWIITLLLVVLLINARGQTPHAADKKIAKYLERIGYWWQQDDGGDSLRSTNAKLMGYLKDVTRKFPLQTRFPLAEKNGLGVSSAGNGGLKIYSWDSQLGGTLHDYSSLAVFRTRAGQSNLTLHDETDNVDYGHTGYSEGGYWYDKIVPIYGKRGVVTYLAFGSAHISAELGEIVFAYQIINNDLVNVPFFKTTKQTVKFIEYSYGRLSFIDKHPKQKSPEMHLNADHTRLYIPIVSGPFHDQLTAKYLVYVFNGNNFVFDRNAK